MQSRMHPRYYVSEDIFRLEQEKIFHKLWLFAGLKAMAPKHGDTAVRPLAGRQITIANEQGCFQAYGNGREIAVEEVGSLLFINLDPQPLPIEEQFSSDMLASLTSLSDAWGREFTLTTWHARFNWKLALENLRDPNHVKYVHAQGFAKYLDFEIGVSESWAVEARQPLLDLTSTAMRSELRRFSAGGGTGVSIPDRRHYPWYDRVRPWGGKDIYYNWLAYPNLHIASGNAGYSFAIECYWPVAPGRTALDLYWIMSEKTQAFDASSQALLGNLHGSKLILDEDFIMLEAIQTGLSNDAPMPHQGQYEAFTGVIERWYSALMETDCEI